MYRNILAASLATAALAIAGPAMAQHTTGGSGTNVNAGAPTHTDTSTMAGQHSTPDTAHNTTTTTGDMSPTAGQHSTVGSTHDTTTTAGGTHNTTNTTAHGANSQGLTHASPTGIAHANANSALAQGAVSSNALPGLTTGLHVQTSTGTMLGTISHVITGTDGSIRQVIVTSPTGQSLQLAPNTLSISGGVVTTTHGG